ncbi:MAG TPA: ATP-binding cassette domain-containing protein [Saprospiraceae bacterium]|nr:ATP-binding cassette domain-containing protein [Saprospiraceae bacterium]
MEAQKEIVIEIKDLYKSFGQNRVLNGFNMTIYKGDSIVLLGKSGSGKSVMIKCLVGLMQPDSGSIKIMGDDPTKLSQKELNLLRSKIGFLFQGSALYDSMTVRENLEFPLRIHPELLAQKETRVKQALESVGLLDAIDLMPSELSGGMKRRIALARAIMLRPKIIIYDEPTTGLDPITSKEITLLIQRIQKEYDATSLIISHDIDFAKAIASRIIMLIDGINYASGTALELEKSTDPKIKAFFKQT